MSQAAEVHKLPAATGAGAASIWDAVADASVGLSWERRGMRRRETSPTAGDLTGKTLLDATNPLQNMKLATGPTTWGRKVASWARWRDRGQSVQ